MFFFTLIANRLSRELAVLKPSSFGGTDAAENRIALNLIRSFVSHRSYRVRIHETDLIFKSKVLDKQEFKSTGSSVSGG